MPKRSLYASAGSMLQCLRVAAALAAFLPPGPAGAALPGAPAPCASCVVVALQPAQVAWLPDRLDGLELLVRVSPAAPDPEAALRGIASKGGTPGLIVEGLPKPESIRPWLHGVTTVVADLASQPLDADRLTFDLKRWAIGVRAAGGVRLRIGLRASTSIHQALLARGVEPYLDFLVADGSPGVDVRWWLTDGVLSDSGAALDATRVVGPERWLWLAPDDGQSVRRLLDDLARAAPLLGRNLVPAPGIPVTCDGRAAEVWLDPTTLRHVALARRCAEGVLSSPAGEPDLRVALSTGDLLITISAPPDHFSDDLEVSAERALRVEEIVARHQAAAARQAAAVRTLISTGSMTLTFEAPGFPAPVAISARTVIYAGEGRTELEQRAITVNGLEFRGAEAPRVPLVEPERVVSPPLAITLTRDYRYTLEGVETMGDTRCYVVAFAPRRTGQSLFKGRAWIAVDDFGLVRVAAVQTNLRGPIVASEQTDEFRREGALWLLARSVAHQSYEGPGHRTPIHRVLDVERHEVNPSSFAERRRAAHASNAVMLRDTPAGFRYLRRANTHNVSAPGESATTGERSPARRADRVRTLAFGLIIDPNISTPLPFAGLNYVDFDLFGTGTQFNGFFGGTYAQVAAAVPSVAGSRWQIAGRAFGLAAAYNDRVFADGREEYSDNLRQRPAHASVWAVRPVTTRLAVRIGYDLDYTHFAAGESTAASFVVPAPQLVHGLRVGLEYQRAGWNLSGWWVGARRSGWRAWGAPAGSDYAPRQVDFQRYGATVARAAVLSPTLIARAELAWMGGHDLDRFSRYAFGTFDNRLRGYPSALIRYDRGGAIRTVIAWAPGRLVRLDGFVDSALVHDPGFGRGHRSFTGIGAALETPAPFGTLAAIEWGYGLQGVREDGRAGTHVIRFSGYKVF